MRLASRGILEPFLRCFDLDPGIYAAVERTQREKVPSIATGPSSAFWVRDL
jgi:hypothetical protein